MLRVYVTGQGRFGAAAAQAVTAAGHQLVGVCAPAWAGPLAGLGLEFGDDNTPYDPLYAYAHRTGTPWTRSTDLRAARIPDRTDVIIAAHSHAFVGRATRARARLAAVGYHPSLLPLHRGRDAIRWTVRDGDRVAGGSVYHLTDNVDGGPLAAQDYCLVPAGATARELWREHLFPLGLQLIDRVLADLDRGVIVAVPQDERLATWEPSWDRPPLYKPELPELGTGPAGVRYTAEQTALRSAPPHVEEARR